MPGMFDDLIPEGKPSGKPSGLFDDLIPQAAPAPSTGGPIEAAADVGRLMLRGAAMGKEATPEDAADRANAIRASMGRKVARGMMPQAPAVQPEQFKPFFDEQRQEMAAASERAGNAGKIAELGGSIVAGGPVFKALNATGAVLKGAPAVGSIVASPWTQAAGAGAILGASEAQGTDTDKRLAAGLGAAGGVAGQALGSFLAGTVNKAAGVFNPKPKIPTPEEIKAGKEAAYAAANDAGVIYSPQFIDRVAREAQEKAAAMAYSRRLHPGANAVFEEIGDRAGKNITLQDADILRRVAGSGYQIGNKDNNRVVRGVVDTLEEAMTNPQAGDVLMGNAAAAIPALKEGRRLAAIDFKLQDIESALQRAQNQAARTGSGGNVDNATRQKFDKLLQSRMNWTPDERAALQQIVQGTPGQDMLRLGGKLSPSGNGLMAALGLGATAANPLMAIPSIVGIGVKKAADQMTARNVEQLAKIVRAGGSRAATEAAPNAVQRLTQAERERLARALSIGLIPSAVAAGAE